MSTEFPATETTEDQQMLSLLADLQRYGTLPAEELKKEIAAATATLARQRSDVNRVRLAVLYTMLRTSPQDDQRALQLLDTVGRTPSASPGVRSLAAVLQAQVIERQRAVKTEQQKGDAAVQKLEALRAMEQSLFRDRVRGGGAGGGAGAGGSGR
jgi:isochorismate hydrolase